MYEQLTDADLIERLMILVNKGPGPRPLSEIRRLEAELERRDVH